MVLEQPEAERQIGQLRRTRGRRPCPNLSEESDIVAACPVFDDLAVDNPPDVDVGPGNL